MSRPILRQRRGLDAGLAGKGRNAAGALQRPAGGPLESLTVVIGGRSGLHGFPMEKRGTTISVTRSACSCMVRRAGRVASPYQIKFDVTVKPVIVYFLICLPIGAKWMKNNVKRLRLRLGITQEELAGRLGVTWQTVSNVERGHSGLSSKKIDKWASALEAEPHEVISAAGEQRAVPVIGYVQAGHFAESWMFDEEDQTEVWVEDEPRFRSFRLRGAIARGPSMNRRWPDGTVLIFTDAVETGEDIVVGKRYVIERERADGLREATVKLLWRDDTGKLWLLPESDDPRFQEPIPLDSADGDTVRIVGRVRYSVSRED